MQQVRQLFEENTEYTLSLIPGSSGKLSAQILNGAPYDVFLAADMKYPRRIFTEGHGAKEPEVLVRGRLVFWSTRKLQEGELEDFLNSDRVKSLAIAQPELAPYGRRARYWMQQEAIYEAILPKVIYGESIGQVNQYIRASTVDAAFTAISAMHAEEMKDIGYWLPLSIEGGEASELDHGLILLTNATADERTVNTFLEYMRSPTVEQVFRDFGYELP
jgi:molybdate transport system substrate-binding protein